MSALGNPLNDRNYNFDHTLMAHMPLKYLHMFLVFTYEPLKNDQSYNFYRSHFENNRSKDFQEQTLNVVYTYIWTIN